MKITFNNTNNNSINQINYQIKLFLNNNHINFKYPGIHKLKCNYDKLRI